MNNLHATPLDTYDTAYPVRSHAHRAKGSWLSWIKWTILTLIINAGFYWAAHHLLKEDYRATLPPGTILGPVPKDVPVKVLTSPVTYRPVTKTIEAYGTLYGYEEVTVCSRIDGRVLSIHHDVADRIRQQEVLLEVDPVDARLAVEQAENSLHVALSVLGLSSPPTADFDLTKLPSVVAASERIEYMRSRYDRTKRLHEKQAAVAAEVETATNEYHLAQAEYANQLLIAKSAVATAAMRHSELKIARQQLIETVIRAPSSTKASTQANIEYTMTQRMVAEGSFVRVGTELFKFVMDDVLKLRVAVPERFASSVAVGQKAEIQSAAFPQPFAGTVTMINPLIDTSTRTFLVEIQIANADHRLKPGGFTKASIRVSESLSAQTVPMAAIESSSGVSKLFVVENDTVRETPVRLGIQTGEWVEVQEPMLSRSAIVVVSGQSQLTDGTHIASRNRLAELKRAEDPLPFQKENIETAHRLVPTQSGEKR